MRISSAQIECFLALAETLHFASAAERCCVSNSAFSQIISRLEEEVGLLLFDRNTRRVYLTVEGVHFRKSAERISAEIGGAVAEMRALRAGSFGRVVLAATPTSCVSWMPRIMKEFKIAHPNVDFDLHEGLSAECLESISLGNADLGIIAEEGNPQEFENLELFRTRYFVIFDKKAELSRRRSVHLADLVGRNYIAVSAQGAPGEDRKRQLANAGIGKPALEVTTHGTQAGFVAAGFGWGLVSEMCLPLCLRPGIVPVRLADADYVGTFYLVQRKERSLSTVARKLREFLIANTELAPGKRTA